MKRQSVRATLALYPSITTNHLAYYAYRNIRETFPCSTMTPTDHRADTVKPEILNSPTIGDPNMIQYTLDPFGYPRMTSPSTSNNLKSLRTRSVPIY